MKDDKTIWDLWNAAYRMELCGGGDIWALSAEWTNRPGFNGITVSQPVAFDEDTDTLTTYSGSKYCIRSYCNGRDKTIEYIKKDIEKSKKYKEEIEGAKLKAPVVE